MTHGTYKTNIIAKDQDGNEAIITLDITIGQFSLPIQFIEKITSSRDIFGVPIPYFLIFIFSLLIFGFSSYYLGLRKIESIGLFLSLISSFTFATITIFVI